MKTAQNRLGEGPLLDARGHLDRAGYDTSLVRRYDRRAIAAPWWRVKEWDYYLITCPRFAVALTIADNGYMGLESVSLLDFERRVEHTQSPMRLLPRGKTGLPASSLSGDVAVRRKTYSLSFQNAGVPRRLTAHLDDFKDKKPIAVCGQAGSFLLQPEDQLPAGFGRVPL